MIRYEPCFPSDSCVVVSVCELPSPSMSDFLEGLESSGWLKHIKAVLDAAVFIAKVSLEANPCCLLVAALNISLGVLCVGCL